MKKVLLFSTVGCNWLRDVEEYSNNKEIKITGFVSSNTQINEVADVLKDALAFGKALPRNFYDYNLDPDFLRYMAPYEMDFQLMLERSAAKSGSYFHSLIVYYKYIKYCESILEQTDPDLVLFDGTPHHAVSYLLYRISIYKKVKTFIIDRLKFAGYCGYFSSYENKSLIEEESKPGSNVPDIRLDIQSSQKEYLETVRTNPKEKNTKSKNKKKYVPMSARYKTGIMATFTSDIFHRRIGIKSSARALINHVLITYQQKVLKRFYEGLCGDTTTFNTKYIYVPLHVQPEKTTVPEGGVYAQQWLLLNNLAHAIPEDWVILVKEHPLTFSKFYSRIDNFRSKSYYLELMSIPKIKFVSLESENNDLIDNAKAVATVTGFAAFEAVARGVPALVFGYSPFIGCDGVFNARSDKDLRSALESIRNGYSISTEEVVQFLKKIEASRFVAFNPNMRKVDKRNEEELKFELFKRIIEDEL